MISEKRRAQIRAAQRRYYQTDKRKALTARYSKSEKRLATQKRYAASAHGQIVTKHHRELRIWIANRYAGKADTVDEARRINAHIRSRLREFIAGQSSGAQVESVSEGRVPTETEFRSH